MSKYQVTLPAAPKASKGGSLKVGYNQESETHELSGKTATVGVPDGVEFRLTCRYYHEDGKSVEYSQAYLPGGIPKAVPVSAGTVPPSVPFQVVLLDKPEQVQKVKKVE